MVRLCFRRRPAIDRDAEIQHLDLIGMFGGRVRHENVGRLQIAMNDPGGMRRRQAVGDLHRQIEQLLRRVRRLNGSAVDVFHDEVIRPHVIEVAQVRMIQRRDGASLAFEAVAKLLGDQLDGDRPVQPRVAGLIDLTHPSRADRRDDLIRAELGAGSKH